MILRIIVVSKLDVVVNCNRKFVQFPDLKFVVSLQGIIRRTVVPSLPG